MAQMSIEDFISDGYTFPGTGGSLVITIEINSGIVHSFEISGVSRSNIVSFSATEDGNEVEVVEFEPGADYAVLLNATNEYVEITIEVGESPSDIDDNYSFNTIFDYEQGQESVVIGQDGYTPPTPSWGDGQHKIYRSGHQVMKMYRSGELIYLRLETGSQPQPVTEPMLIHNANPITGDYANPTDITVASTDTSTSFDVEMADQNTPWAISDGMNVLASGTGSTSNVSCTIYPTNPEFMSTIFHLQCKKDGDGDSSWQWTGEASYFKFTTE